jgi:hypothetical protein
MELRRQCPCSWEGLRAGTIVQHAQRLGLEGPQHGGRAEIDGYFVQFRAYVHWPVGFDSGLNLPNRPECGVTPMYSFMEAVQSWDNPSLVFGQIASQSHKIQLGDEVVQLYIGKIELAFIALIGGF